MKTKKQKIKQQITAVLVVAFMFVMISGCYNVGSLFAATGVNVTLIQNLLAGTLSVDSLATLGFNDLTVGVPLNSLANLTVVNMADWRGNGAGWTVSAYCNALTVATAGVNTLANTVIFINTGTVQAVNGSVTGVAANQPNVWRALSTAPALVNTSTNNGMGSYNLTNTLINVVYNGRGDQKIGTYQALLTLTIQ